MVNPLAKPVPVDNIKLKVGNPLAKPVPLVDIKLKVANPLVQHVPVVLTVMLVPQVVY